MGEVVSVGWSIKLIDRSDKMSDGLYHVSLDADVAKDLATAGATVLMMGVPGTDDGASTLQACPSLAFSALST